MGSSAAARVAAVDSSRSLLPAARTIGFAREVLNTTGSTVLLAVAGGLILLGSVLRRKLISENAREQTPKPAFNSGKEFTLVPIEKTTPLDAVTPKASVVSISEASTPMPIDAGVSDEQNLRLA